MFKVIKSAVIVICALLLVFTFLPTGSSASEVVTGYRNTMSFSSAASYLLYMDQFGEAIAADYDTQYFNTVGEEIAHFATLLCEEYGTGWGKSGGNIAKHAIYYTGVGSTNCGRSDCPNPTGDAAVGDPTVGYGSFNLLHEHLKQLVNNDVSHVHISCCAFATYCMKAFLKNLPWDASCSTLIRDNYSDVIEGDGSWDYIRENASPGDLVMRAGGPSVYKHAMLYVGPYDSPDGDHFDYAIAQASTSRDNKDLYVQDVTNSGNDSVYLVKLSEACMKYYGTEAVAIDGQFGDVLGNIPDD